MYDVVRKDVSCKMKNRILLILIIICILSIAGCEKKETMEENQIHEIYSHQFLYIAHNIEKSVHNISLTLESKEIDDKEINWITREFEILELMLKDSKELPNHIDQETKEIYDFLNTILYPKFVSVRKEFEKKKVKNGLDYNYLEEYVRFLKKIETDAKWTDINLNTKSLKSSNEELSIKEIIQLIAQDVHKLKEIVKE